MKSKNNIQRFGEFKENLNISDVRQLLSLLKGRIKSLQLDVEKIDKKMKKQIKESYKELMNWLNLFFANPHKDTELFKKSALIKNSVDLEHLSKVKIAKQDKKFTDKEIKKFNQWKMHISRQRNQLSTKNNNTKVEEDNISTLSRVELEHLTKNLIKTNKQLEFMLKEKLIN